MKEKIKPLGSRVVVERIEAEKTKGGILLPETAKEKPRQGKVISVGPGQMDDKGVVRALDVKEGDQVLFSSYAGTEYTSGDVEFLIMNEDDILAVIN